jgi:hypothetical protein
VYTPFQVYALSSLFFVGTLVSVVAAVVIELFVFAALFQGLVVICSPLGVLGGFVLLLLAFAALYSYSRGSSHARWSGELHSTLGYTSGFYSSPGGGVGVLVPPRPPEGFVLSICYRDHSGLQVEA